LKFENDYLKLLDNMKPLQTSYTSQDNGAGAPKKEESKLSDKGLDTKNKEANKNRAK
jgi:hypothetical protein